MKHLEFGSGIIFGRYGSGSWKSPPQARGGAGQPDRDDGERLLSPPPVAEDGAPC